MKNNKKINKPEDQKATAMKSIDIYEIDVKDINRTIKSLAQNKENVSSTANKKLKDQLNTQMETFFKKLNKDPNNAKWISTNLKTLNVWLESKEVSDYIHERISKVYPKGPMRIEAPKTAQPSPYNLVNKAPIRGTVVGKKIEKPVVPAVGKAFPSNLVGPAPLVFSPTGGPSKMNSAPKAMPTSLPPMNTKNNGDTAKDAKYTGAYKSEVYELENNLKLLAKTSNPKKVAILKSNLDGRVSSLLGKFDAVPGWYKVASNAAMLKRWAGTGFISANLVKSINAKVGGPRVGGPSAPQSSGPKSNLDKLLATNIRAEYDAHHKGKGIARKGEMTSSLLYKQDGTSRFQRSSKREGQIAVLTKAVDDFKKQGLGGREAAAKGLMSVLSTIEKEIRSENNREPSALLHIVKHYSSELAKEFPSVDTGPKMGSSKKA